MARLQLILLSWFGAGYSPKAPGTVGSAASLPFAWVIAMAWGSSGLLIAVVIVFLIGWLAARATVEAHKDPGWVVVDEVAGQWLTLAFIPPDLFLYSIGFILFRLFDIFKPWPIRFLEQNIPGALAIMIDDIGAAAYAGITLYLVFLIVGV